MNLSRLERIADDLRAEIQDSARGEDIDTQAENATELSFYRVTQLSKLEAAEEIIRGVIEKTMRRLPEPDRVSAAKGAAERG